MNENKNSQFPVFIIAAALVTTPLFFLPVLRSFIVPRITLMEISIIFVIALFLIEGVERKTKDAKLFIPWALLNIVFLFSILRSPSLLTGWKIFLFFFLLSTFCVIIPTLVGIKRRFDILLVSILVPGVINSFYVFLQYSGIDLPIMKNAKFVILGTLGSPGMLGGYFSICCVISYHYFVCSKGRIKSIFTAFLFLLFLSVSAATLSRTSIISIAGGLAGYFAVSLFLKKSFSARFTKSAAGIFVTILLAAAVLIPSTGIYNYAVNSNKDVKSYFFNRYKSNSALQRRLIWKSALEIINEKPMLGAGAGSFFYEYPKAQAKVLEGRELTGAFPRIAANRIASYAHNDYLQIAAESGIPGLICFLMFPFFSFISLYRKCKNKDPFALNYAPVLFSGILAVMIQALFDFPSYMPATALIFWLFLGSCHIKSYSSKPAHGTLNVKARFSIYAISGILAFTVLMPLISAINLSVANKSLVSGDVYKAKESLENALAYDPSEPEIYASLGRLERIKGNFSQSSKYYDKALSLSNHPSHYYGKGMSAFLSGNLEEAKISFYSVLEIDPRSTDAMLAMALIYMESEDTRNSSEMLRNILVVDPANKEALNYLKQLHEDPHY